LWGRFERLHPWLDVSSTRRFLREALWGRFERLHPWLDVSSARRFLREALWGRFERLHRKAATVSSLGRWSSRTSNPL
jgi:uncharacterized membrane protein